MIVHEIFSKCTTYFCKYYIQVYEGLPVISNTQVQFEVKYWKQFLLPSMTIIRNYNIISKQMDG